MQNGYSGTMRGLPAEGSPTRFNTVGLDALPRYYTNARMNRTLANQTPMGMARNMGVIQAPLSAARNTGVANTANYRPGGCSCARR